MVFIMVFVIYIILFIYFFYASVFSIYKKDKFKVFINVAIFLCLIYIGFCTIITVHNFMWSLPGVENKNEHVYNCKIC